MKSLIVFVCINLSFANAFAQVQQYSFSNQAEYDQWNSVSSSAPNSFSYDISGQAVLYDVATNNIDYLLSTQVLSTQLPFPIQGDFRISFKVRKLLPTSHNTYFPLLLTTNILQAPNEHPWRKGPATPATMGDLQTVPLLGILFTHNQLGLVYRQLNASFPQINYVSNFEIPSNTDLWIELVKSCSNSIVLNVYNDGSMSTTPLVSEQYSIANITIPLNALYIANGNGNGEWTEHSDLLDDYRLEILPGNPVSFSYSIEPSSCFEPGLFQIDAINGGVPPYQISFNGQPAGTTEFIFEDEQTLAVTITDSEGCSSSSGIQLTSLGGTDALEFPNVLTPNGDDDNDKWFVNGECIKSFECAILDRWGNEIVTLTDIMDSWDGTSGFVNCSEGVYFYHAKVAFTSGESASYHGFISLIR
jgi:gliding motility-associated-like protein